MRLATEARLVQNPAVGALALWAFVTQYVESHDAHQGPMLPLCLPILPLVLNHEASAALHARRFDGGLELALAEHRAIVAGLQERMETMTDQTMHALNLAFAAKLLDYDGSTGELLSCRKTPPMTAPEGSDLRKITATARRLGHWFAVMQLPRVFALLSISVR
jgi:hypothetical protein